MAAKASEHDAKKKKTNNIFFRGKHERSSFPSYSHEAHLIPKSSTFDVSFNDRD